MFFYNDAVILFSPSLFIKDIYCLPPSPPRNGLISGSCGRTLGSVCSFGCNEGYILQNEATKRTCQLRAPNQILGYWDGSELTCKSRFKIWFVMYFYIQATTWGPSISRREFKQKSFYVHIIKRTKTFLIRFPWFK